MRKTVRLHVGSMYARTRGRHAALAVICVITLACRGSEKSNDMSDSANGRLAEGMYPPRAGMGAGDSTVRTGNTATSTPGAEQKQVLDELGMLGGKPIETLSAVEARKQPSPADAVMALLKKQGKPTTPEAVGSIANQTIATSAGPLPVRVYTPAGKGPFPVIVYYHGGGFVIATIDTYDGSARALANAAAAVLVSVEYRKAPEHKFPAAHDDALAAYQWVLANAEKIQGDPARVAIVGESAGGNLAMATAIAARDKGIQLPTSILAVYPIAGSDTNTVSYRENANAKPLSRPMMVWFTNKYVRSPADVNDPRLNLLAANLKGLPPVTIINAEIDPLRTDGELLAAKLKDAGVTVDRKLFDGVAHEFFGQGVLVPAAKEAVQFGAKSLKAGFGR